MPSKFPLPQVNLKFQPADYTMLQHEAQLAGVSVQKYVAHLVAQRGQQPLAAQVEPVRTYYHAREQALQERLQQYQQHELEWVTLRHRIRALEAELVQLAQQKGMEQLLAERLQPFPFAPLTPVALPSLPPDAFTDRVVEEP